MRPVNLEKRPADLGNPQEGDIVYGHEIGRRNNGAYIWKPCVDCGKPRWVLKYNGCQHKRCYSCSAIRQRGRLGPHWRGGKCVNGCGYMTVRIYADDPTFGLMNKKPHGVKEKVKVVLEHRLVMTRFLGRRLESWEIVHHRNGIRTDNRLSNLELVTPDSHCIYSQLEKDNKALQSKVIEMDVEIQVLRLELEVIKMELSGVVLNG